MPLLTGDQSTALDGAFFNAIGQTRLAGVFSLAAVVNDIIAGGGGLPPLANSLQLLGGLAGSNLATLQAAGVDANIGINLVGKGTGSLTWDTNQFSIDSSGNVVSAGSVTATGGVLTNTVSAATASSVSVMGAPVDASNAVGVLVGSSTALANAGAKLFVVKNAGTEKFSISATGAVNGLSTNGAVVISTLATPVNAAFSTATTGGSLTAATYYYLVAALDATGTTLASTETSQVVPAGTNTNTVTVNWGLVPGATGYKVYGRTTGAETLAATIASGSTTTWLDTGAALLGNAQPQSGTSGVLTLPGFDGALANRSISFGSNSSIVGFGSYLEFTGIPVYASQGLMTNNYGYNMIAGGQLGGTIRRSEEHTSEL